MSTSGKAEDETLAEKAGKGDVDAFETLVLRYQDRVYSLLCRLSGSDEEAEDLAQETFMKAYRALGSFRQGSKFYTWLFRIAVNTSYSRGRQIQRRRKHEGVSLDAGTRGADGNGDDANSLGASAASTGEAPDERLERETIQIRVREGVAQLDPDYRAVLLLRDMDGLDYDAIAETLEITRAAVKSRLHRARLELARILKDLKPEGVDGV
ncbi:MAG: sigma-70 family RNA polymerase sigma factor [Planctomycetes bacterium]|nr:sigma-70 family RNA polymerase sigma factor [Planctomycetota bacterium]